jgi:hypothetical protein
VIGTELLTTWLETKSLGWLGAVTREVGAGSITASILGLTVDTFLKGELLRDVFQAAFSYVLPEELRAEVHRVINYKFICKRSYTIVKITRLCDDLVKVEIMHERLIENITKYAESFLVEFQVDEWGFRDHR